MSLIDIHTHNLGNEAGVITVRNLFPHENIPDPVPDEYFSVGLHPWLLESSEDSDDQICLLEKKAKLGNVIAVGECGIDRFAKAAIEIQVEIFLRQAEIAESLGKPVIIHCVKAFNEIIKLRRNFRSLTPWIIHGYNGSPELTVHLVDQGFMFSFGKALLNENSKAFRSFQQLNDNMFFLETDESDLPVSDMYAFAARSRSCGIDNLELQVENNFKRIFFGA